MSSITPLSLKDGLLKLAGLAETEAKILKIQCSLEEIPQGLRDLEAKKNTLQAQVEGKNKQLEGLEREYRAQEFELNDSKEKIKNRETRLFEIKTTKEYQAVSKEIAETKKRNSELETLLLQKMEQLEILKKEISPLQEELEIIQGKLTYEKERIETELQALQSRLVELSQVKNQALHEIDSSLISYYERVLIKRQPAIAPVRSGSCYECNINIPPQLYINLQRFQEIVSCPSCNRILYIEMRSET